MKNFSAEEKRILLLLQTVIFYYHGLDEEELASLVETASGLGAEKELKWAIAFVAEDELTGFERARTYFRENNVVALPKEKKMLLLDVVWEASNDKGYITEIEATGMLRLAKDWGVQHDLLLLARAKLEGSSD